MAFADSALSWTSIDEKLPVETLSRKEAEHHVFVLTAVELFREPQPLSALRRIHHDLRRVVKAVERVENHSTFRTRREVDPVRNLELRCRFDRYSLASRVSARQSLFRTK